MRDHIANIIMQSIADAGTSKGDALMLYWESIGRLADYATDEILDVVDEYAQSQWDEDRKLSQVQ